VRHWWAARGIIVSRLMRVRFGPVHLARELPRGHSRAMLAAERNALINEIDAAMSTRDDAGPATGIQI
jgi:16S rRNA U516 pseudouridylate synthase RsuA-like enzyme